MPRIRCARTIRVGSLEVGKYADLAAFDVADYREIPYYFGMNLLRDDDEARQRSFIREWRRAPASESGLRGVDKNFSRVQSTEHAKNCRMRAEFFRRPRSRPRSMRSSPRCAQSRALRYSIVNSDPDHNRCVVTLAGEPDACGGGCAARRWQSSGARRSRRNTPARIRGLARRMWFPSCPIEGVSWKIAWRWRKRVGREIWKRYKIPVYFYEAAALTAGSRQLRKYPQRSI